MLTEQVGVCAICGEAEIAKNARGDVLPLGVDHNHKTKKVRALLCKKCNTLLGVACESPAILRAAIEYLEKHGE
jgi:hypothetical protein